MPDSYSIDTLLEQMVAHGASDLHVTAGAYDRPVRGQRPRVDAGKDAHAGGIWLSVSKFGLVVRIIHHHSTLGKSPHPCAKPCPGSGAIPHDSSADGGHLTCADDLRFSPPKIFTSDSTSSTVSIP
jgi:hypothetical protein